MEMSQRTIAARPQELGEVVLIEPRTAEWLREEIAEREDGFFSNNTDIGCEEDATEEERFDWTYIQPLKDALEGEFSCDKNGYINREGGTSPSCLQMRSWSWRDEGGCALSHLQGADHERRPPLIRSRLRS